MSRSRRTRRAHEPQIMNPYGYLLWQTASEPLFRSMRLGLMIADSVAREYIGTRLPTASTDADSWRVVFLRNLYEGLSSILKSHADYTLTMLRDCPAEEGFCALRGLSDVKGKKFSVYCAKTKEAKSVLPVDQMFFEKALDALFFPLDADALINTLVATMEAFEVEPAVPAKLRRLSPSDRIDYLDQMALLTGFSIFAPEARGRPGFSSFYKTRKYVLNPELCVKFITADVYRSGLWRELQDLKETYYRPCVDRWLEFARKDIVAADAAREGYRKIIMTGSDIVDDLEVARMLGQDSELHKGLLATNCDGEYKFLVHIACRHPSMDTLGELTSSAQLLDCIPKIKITDDDKDIVDETGPVICREPLHTEEEPNLASEDHIAV